MKLRPLTPPQVVAFVLVLSISAFFGNSVYLPFVDYMARDFQASPSTIQLTLSAYLIGLGLPQLVYGPLSDRYGRKPVLTGALFLFVVAGALCVWAQSITLFIVARLLQGIAASALLTISRVIIVDVFDPAARQRIIGHAGAANAIGPIFGPLIFGALLPEASWRVTLVFMTTLGIVMLLVAWLPLQETRPAGGQRSLTLGSLATSFRMLFSHREFIALGACVWLAYAAMFCWFSWAGSILVGALGVPAERFGYFFSVTIVGFMGGSFLGGRIANTLSLRALLLGGSAVMLLAACGLLGSAFQPVPDPLLIAAAVMVLTFGVGIVIPQAFMAALRPFASITGTAAGLLGSTQMVVSGLIAVIPGWVHFSSLKGMAIVIGALTVLCHIVILRFLLHETMDEVDGARAKKA